jgi:hypothetical protein
LLGSQNPRHIFTQTVPGAFSRSATPVSWKGGSTSVAPSLILSETAGSSHCLGKRQEPAKRDNPRHMHGRVETDCNNASRGRFARSVQEAKIGLIGSNPVRAWPSDAGLISSWAMRPRTYQTLFFVGRFRDAPPKQVHVWSWRTFATGRLPIHRRAFVVLICLAILALSGWREWSTREAELRNAEVDSRSRSRNTRTTLWRRGICLAVAGCRRCGMPGAMSVADRRRGSSALFRQGKRPRPAGTVGADHGLGSGQDHLSKTAWVRPGCHLPDKTIRVRPDHDSLRGRDDCDSSNGS